MSEIVTERSGSILSIQFNRPEKKNALTMSMYDTVAELLNAAAGDDGIRVVLLHGAGEQEADETLFARPDRGGSEDRDPGVRLAAPISGCEGSPDGVLRQAEAGLQQDDHGATGRQPVTGARRDLP